MTLAGSEREPSQFDQFKERSINNIDEKASRAEQDAEGCGGQEGGKMCVHLCACSALVQGDPKTIHPLSHGC